MTTVKDGIVEVKRRINISDYIENAGISLKPSGSGSFKGLCPFHNEKTPSFTVNDNYQNFRCFGCSESGDLIAFVMKYENLTFMESLRKLAEEIGIEITLDSQDEKSDVDYREVRAVLAATTDFYKKHFAELPPDHVAVKEVTERGLPTDGEISYGYAPAGNALLKYLKSKKFSEKSMLDAGVVRKNEEANSVYDFWRSRLMFFVTDTTGKTVGFSGRKTLENDKGGKYINSPEGPMFDKGTTVYNIHNAKNDALKDGVVYVAEGQFDVAALSHSGLKNAVASLGTAFTERHANVLRRIVGDGGKVVFCFDGDKAGVAAAEKVFKEAPALHSSAYVVVFPEGLDPSDYRLQNGDDALRDFVLNSQKPIVDFVLDQTEKRFDLHSAADRANYIAEAAPIVKTISSPSMRETFMKKVALNSITSLSVVEEAVRTAENFQPKVRATPVHGNDDSQDAKENTQKSSDSVFADKSDRDKERMLVARLKEGGKYDFVARIAALSFLDRKYAVRTANNRKLFPKEFMWVPRGFYEACKAESFRPLPEDFRFVRIMRKIVEKNYFPLMHVMEERDVDELFNSLLEGLKDENSKEQALNSHVSGMDFIKDAPSDDISFLEKALTQEQQGS